MELTPIERKARPAGLVQDQYIVDLIATDIAGNPSEIAISFSV